MAVAKGLQDVVEVGRDSNLVVKKIVERHNGRVWLDSTARNAQESLAD